MLTTVEGTFRHGQVEFDEDPPETGEARVLVTFLGEDQPAGRISVAEANRRTLEFLDAWQADPLSPAEAQVLDDFDEFQSRHPMKFALPDEEP